MKYVVRDPEGNKVNVNNTVSSYLAVIQDTDDIEKFIKDETTKLTKNGVTFNTRVKVADLTMAMELYNDGCVAEGMITDMIAGLNGFVQANQHNRQIVNELKELNQNLREMGKNKNPQ